MPLISDRIPDGSDCDIAGGRFVRVNIVDLAASRAFHLDRAIEVFGEKPVAFFASWINHFIPASKARKNRHLPRNSHLTKAPAELLLL